MNYIDRDSGVPGGQRQQMGRVSLTDKWETSLTGDKDVDRHLSDNTRVCVYIFPSVRSKCISSGGPVEGQYTSERACLLPRWTDVHQLTAIYNKF